MAGDFFAVPMINKEFPVRRRGLGAGVGDRRQRPRSKRRAHRVFVTGRMGLARFIIKNHGLQRNDPSVYASTTG